jgi:hypothetical protein
VDVHSWIAADLHSVRSKLTDSVLGIVPEERWIEQADHGGSSIVHLALHLTRHHDVAVNTAIRNHAPLFSVHRAALGLAEAPPYAGMTEKEDRAVTTAVALPALTAYVDAVFDGTATWMAGVGTMMLDTVPDTSHRLSHHAGLTVDDVGWLHNMWTGKPVWWLIQWPVIGHGHTHVGEAVSVRNRMGLSPF